MSVEANREGFRILRKIPALFPMELLWRWSFGLGMFALAFFAYTCVRQAVLFSDADLQLLQSEDPIAVAVTLESLLTPALPLLFQTLTQLFAVAAVLWIVASTIGRGVITRSIVRHFAASYGVSISPDSPRWFGFAILNFSRVLMLLVLVIGYLGGSTIAGIVNSDASNVILSAMVLFFSLSLAAVVWSFVNWVLSLAPIFLVRDGLSPLDSVVAAIEFARRNFPRLRAISLWNSSLRGLAATLISIMGISTAVLRLPSWTMIMLLVFETLIYLLISDVFLLARFGAYASVAIRELVLVQQIQGPADRSGIGVR